MTTKKPYIIRNILMLMAIAILIQAAITQPVQAQSDPSDLEGIFYAPREPFDDPNHFALVAGSAFGILPKDLPAVRNQGRHGLCATFCATAMMEIARCKLIGTLHCNSIKDSERISVASMLMYRDNKDSPNIAAIGPLVGSGDSKLYEIMNKMQSNALPPFFYSESCFPYERIMRQPVMDSEEKSEAFFDRLRLLFGKAKQYLAGGGASAVESCVECMQMLALIRSYLTLNLQPANIHSALQKKTFNEFLYSIVFEEHEKSNPDCRMIIMPKHSYFEHYPKMAFRSGDFTSPKAMFKVLDEQIKLGRPVSLSAICSAKSQKTGDCVNHCVVITASKQLKNVATGEIVMLYHVLNSWGKEWQSLTNNGWVRADLLRRLTRSYDDPNIEKPYELRQIAFEHSLTLIEED